MIRTLSRLACAALFVPVAAGSPVAAQDQGDFTLGIGVHNVDPTGNGSNTDAGKIKAKDSVRPTLTAEYFVLDRIGIELLVAWPFEHDLHLKGVGKIGKAKQLPPTLSVQYHLVNSSPITPFAGIGVNYTRFFNDSGKGALKGLKLDLGDSWGVAFHAGVDYRITEHGSLRADIRYMDIDTQVKVAGNRIGKVKVDPLVYGVAYVHRF